MSPAGRLPAPVPTAVCRRSGLSDDRRAGRLRPPAVRHGNRDRIRDGDLSAATASSVQQLNRHDGKLSAAASLRHRDGYNSRPDLLSTERYVRPASLPTPVRALRSVPRAAELPVRRRRIDA